LAGKCRVQTSDLPSACSSNRIGPFCVTCGAPMHQARTLAGHDSGADFDPAAQDVRSGERVKRLQRRGQAIEVGAHHMLVQR
jgi:hypothetical protein